MKFLEKKWECQKDGNFFCEWFVIPLNTSGCQGFRTVYTKFPLFVWKIPDEGEGEGQYLKSSKNSGPHLWIKPLMSIMKINKTVGDGIWALLQNPESKPLTRMILVLVLAAQGDWVRFGS